MRLSASSASAKTPAFSAVQASDFNRKDAEDAENRLGVDQHLAMRASGAATRRWLESSTAPEKRSPLARHNQNMANLTSAFFARDTIEVARDLIGTTLRVGDCEGRIVETEAYTTDAASHSVTRRKQSLVMQKTFGHVYVYFIYGMYYCLNFTTDRRGPGAVLIRAVEPTRGLELMSERRGLTDIRRLASGPGRLCQAFGLDLRVNGERIGRRIKVKARTETPDIASSKRIGISRDAHLEWRFYEAESPFVSR